MASLKILPKISGHADLQVLDPNEQQILCDEIRQFLVQSVSKTGGHLASNLGVVELSVALETVFNTNIDRLVFDVGHQSYVHKILTGRQTDFDHLRQFGGIAGFPKPSESETDAFVAGHASSSVSIALGMARARTLQEEDYNVIALLGDGAATGGMIYEGLNDAAVSKEPMIVILNDNEMSIDHNVGGMAKHLYRLRTKERYLGAKARYRRFLHKIPGGETIHRLTSHAKAWVRRVLLPTSLFENMGMTYLGPVDGHDLQELIRILKVARDLQAPVLVHVITQKGHGYKFAEESPSKFHGVGKFDPDTGSVAPKSGKDFSTVFGQTMCALAAENPKVCAITAAMPGGTGLLEYRKQYPKRFFDVGIAEEHAVSMSGGLAKQGMVPVVALYSTFLQRSYDQIMQDIALLNLHVVLAVDRAGLVGEDGETHHGIFDVGFLRQVPNMRILCPASGTELQEMLRWAVNEYDGPVAIRYPRGGDGDYVGSAWDAAASVAAHCHGKDAAIVTYGNLVNEALKAAQILVKKGKDISVVRLTQLYGDHSGLESALSGIENVLIAEEASSGICAALALALSKDHKVCCADLGKQFVTHGSVAQLRKHYGLDAESMAQKILEVLENEN